MDPTCLVRAKFSLTDKLKNCLMKKNLLCALLVNFKISVKR